nr:synaptobrevin, longin-like domain protein [Tanacetum cinerariifolium]
MNEETKILATVNGKPKTISELSLRRRLKLNDAEGISSLPDTKLFENLALMGYNILPNQRFTFQKGQFPHQWKFLIHTIMQCLSPKSTGFNEFSSNIATAMVCLATNKVYNFSKMIFDETPTLRQYYRRATRIAQSKALSTAANKPASLLRDDSQGEAFLTVSSLDAGQAKESINKTSALPHELTPRVTSLDADEGTSSLKARIKPLEDKDRGSAKPSENDAPIKGRSMKIGEEVRVERSTELGSNDTEEMVKVLSSIKAANILTSGVAAFSVSPVVGVSIVGVPTVSRLFPTVSVIFTTANVVTPYSRRPRGILAKDKDQRMNEQLARDAEIAKIHVEEELSMLIDGLDRSNEVIAKHLQEYEKSKAELTIGEKIDLINDLVKYQDHHAKILKYQTQQSKPLSKKEQREFYMSVLRSHAGWKTKHFRGMTLEEIKEKFILVWKQLEDFVPMSSTEEGKRMKRKGLKLDQGSAKRIKTSKDVSEEDLKGMMQLVTMEEKDYWKIIRLGGHTAVYQFFVDMLKQFNKEDLHQLWALVKETLSIRQASRDKEKELWVKLKRLFEPDFEDQLWTHNQNLMRDPLD